jgi:hypothetical protein
MWMIIGQSGVTSNIVDISVVFVPVMWGLLGAAVLPVVALVGMAVQEYWTQPPARQQEPVAAETQLAA